MAVVKTIFSNIHSFFLVNSFLTLFFCSRKHRPCQAKMPHHIHYQTLTWADGWKFLLFQLKRRQIIKILVPFGLVFFPTLFKTQCKLYFTWISFLHHMQHLSEWKDWSASSYDRSQYNFFEFSRYFPCCFISHFTY